MSGHRYLRDEDTRLRDRLAWVSPEHRSRRRDVSAAGIGSASAGVVERWTPPELARAHAALRSTVAPVAAGRQTISMQNILRGSARLGSVAHGDSRTMLGLDKQTRLVGRALRRGRLLRRASRETRFLSAIEAADGATAPNFCPQHPGGSTPGSGVPSLRGPGNADAGRGDLLTGGRATC